MSLLKRIENGQTTSSDAGNGKDSGSQLGKLQSRSAPSGGVSTQRDTYSDLKSRVQNRLLAELDPTMDVTRVGEVRNTIQDLFEQVLAEENIVLTRQERHRLFEQIAAEILCLIRHPDRAISVLFSL